MACSVQIRSFMTFLEIEPAIASYSNVPLIVDPCEHLLQTPAIMLLPRLAIFCGPTKRCATWESVAFMMWINLYRSLDL